MSRLGNLTAAAALSVVLATPALADGHGGHGGGGFHHGGEAHHHEGFHHEFHHQHHNNFGFFFGGVGGFYDPWWYGYPSAAYAYPYYPAAPAVIPTAPPQNVWYFCRPANAYYPYVASCPVPWEPVPARPG